MFFAFSCITFIDGRFFLISVLISFLPFPSLPILHSYFCFATFSYLLQLLELSYLHLVFTFIGIPASWVFAITASFPVVLFSMLYIYIYICLPLFYILCSRPELGQPIHFWPVSFDWP